MKKTITIILAMVFTIGLFTGCKKEKDSDPIKGTWVCKVSVGSNQYFVGTLVFDGESSVTLKDEAYYKEQLVTSSTKEGTYSVAETTVTTVIKGGKSSYEWSESNNTLTWSEDKDFIYKKK